MSFAGPCQPEIHSMKFIARKQWFIAGGDDGCIHVYTCATGIENVGKFKAHDRSVESLDVHASEPLVLSASTVEHPRAFEYSKRAQEDFEKSCLTHLTATLLHL